MRVHKVPLSSTPIVGVAIVAMPMLEPLGFDPPHQFTEIRASGWGLCSNDVERFVHQGDVSRVRICHCAPNIASYMATAFLIAAKSIFNFC